MSGYLSVIKSPVVTEKASLSSEKFARYALYVSVDADKSQIKKAIEWFYGVNVVSVATMVVKGKSKRFKGVLGSRKKRKKVYFSLVKGQSIDVVEA